MLKILRNIFSKNLENKVEVKFDVVEQHCEKSNTDGSKKVLQNYQYNVFNFAEKLLTDSNIEYFVNIGDVEFMSHKEISKEQVVLIEYNNNLDLQRSEGYRVFTFDEVVNSNEILKILEKAVVVCAKNTLNKNNNQSELLGYLGKISEITPYLLLSCYDKQKVETKEFHKDDILNFWSKDELLMELEKVSFNKMLVGHTSNIKNPYFRDNLFVLSGRNAVYKKCDLVNVQAIIHTFNEDDIIVDNINYLLKNDIDVLILDNHSTDNTYNLVKEHFGNNNRVELRKFPDEETGMYEWKIQLEETEKISRSSNYDWTIHYDADEFRESPWSRQGVTLREAISFVDSLGYNCINFSLMNFVLTKGYDEELSLRSRLNRFKFGDRPGHKVQMKAWRNCQDVNISDGGGHNAIFENKNLYPINFLTNHYSIRSAELGHKKIFGSRKARFEKERNLYGWHTHYDTIVQDSDLYTEKEKSLEFTENVYDEYIIEILSMLDVENTIKEEANEEN